MTRDKHKLSHWGGHKNGEDEASAGKKNSCMGANIVAIKI